MGYYNIVEEKKEHPYQYYGKVLEEVHGDAVFLMKSALNYVIDDYDAYLGSVELSHYEDLGYFKVVDFQLLQDSDVLDLTWMKKDDIFILPNNVQYGFLGEVKTNIDNLGYSKLPNNSSNHVLLTIDGSNSKSSIIHQIKDFKYFISRYSECLSGIRLEGFSPTLKKLLMVYGKKKNIAICEQTGEKVKTKC